MSRIIVMVTFISSFALITACGEFEARKLLSSPEQEAALNENKDDISPGDAPQTRLEEILADHYLGRFNSVSTEAIQNLQDSLKAVEIKLVGDNGGLSVEARIAGGFGCSNVLSFGPALVTSEDDLKTPLTIDSNSGFLAEVMCIDDSCDQLVVGVIADGTTSADGFTLVQMGSDDIIRGPVSVEKVFSPRSSEGAPFQYSNALSISDFVNTCNGVVF